MTTFARAALFAAAAVGVVGCIDFGEPIRQPVGMVGVPTVRIGFPVPPVNLAVGDTVRFAAEFRDATGTLQPNAMFTWSSSDDAVASIDARGLLRAAATGETDVRATSAGVESAPAHVVVGAAAPRFSTDVAPIFTSNCATAGCHSAPVQAGLDLRASVAYANIVNVLSTENPQLQRIKPGDPDNSYLLRKLSDCGNCYIGARMPFGRPPLPTAQLQLLRDWVAAGAAP